MRALGFVGILGLGAVLSSACGGRGEPTAVIPQNAGDPAGGVPRATRSSGSFALLYSFGGNRGESPEDLTVANPRSTPFLYGITFNGGTSDDGTIFSLKTDGSERVLYDFSGGQNGAGPSGALTHMNGTFYGVTAYTEVTEGQAGGGTVFAFNRPDQVHALYVFQGSPDGSLPIAKLAALNDILYGTTEEGGTSPCSGLGGDGCGTVFSTTTGGQETVLHSFAGYPNDGAIPEAPLLVHNGKLYGTTGWGGSGGCYGSRALGCGTVFTITTSGEEHVLHSFTGGSDGAYAYSGLTNVNGTFYGTTYEGGSSSCYGSGCGAVFSITPSGTEKVVYGFKGGNDGAYPDAGLTLLNGTLYGTTIEGGGTGCQGAGCGTIFAVTTGGKEHIVHRFNGTEDGKFPDSDLTALNGSLYGTSPNGGSRHHGTAFALTP